MTIASVRLNERLELELHSIAVGSEVKVRLNRLQAQELANALNCYAGVPSEKGLAHGKLVLFGAEDRTPPTLEQRQAERAKNAPPVKLHKGAFWLPGGDRSKKR